MCGSPATERYLAVAGLFVCGLASKPMVITLPFVLLLLDYWPLTRIRGVNEEERKDFDATVVAACD